MRVLVVSRDHVGRTMAGPGIRYLGFARELSRQFDVTLAVPSETDVEPQGFDVVVVSPSDGRRLTSLSRGFDVVVAQALPPGTMLALAGSSTRTIYDLYAPVVLEGLALEDEERTRRARLFRRMGQLDQALVLRTGSGFVCASERQRDFWLGGLAALGRLEEAHRRDPTARALIDVVAFGIDEQPPRPGPPKLKGVVAGIGERDRVLLWGGGIWDWLDPLIVIEAAAELSRRRDDVRLYFLGLARPSPRFAGMPMVERARRLAGELGVLDRVVFFNSGWVPHAELGSYLQEADLGVSAHFDHLEARFAFRTRLLDCFWAGLPVVTTGGDALGELVAARELGRVVDAGDREGWVSAIEQLLDDEGLRERIRRNAEAVREEFAWPRVVRPLARMVEQVARSTSAPYAARVAAVEHFAVRARLMLANRGGLGGAGHVLRRTLGR